MRKQYNLNLKKQTVAAVAELDINPFVQKQKQEIDFNFDDKFRMALNSPE